MYLGSAHNGSRGGYFTHGVAVTYAQIMGNQKLAEIFKTDNREINLWPREKVGCFIGITHAIDDQDCGLDG